MSTLKSPSFGHITSLGALYDARTNSFLERSLINTEIPKDAISSVETNQTKDMLSTNCTLKQKFENFGVGNDLISGFLAGMINAEGASKYLLQPRDPQPIVHRAFHRVTTTRQETLNTSHESLKSLYDFSTFLHCPATHFVAGIAWGARTVVTASRPLGPGADRAYHEAEMDKLFQGFALLLLNDLQVTNFSTGVIEDTVSAEFYSDLPVARSQTSMTLQKAFHLAQQTQQSIKSTANGFGIPITYTMLPISFLMTQGIFIPDLPVVEQPSTECVVRYMTLLDDLNAAQQSLLAYHKTLLAHRSVVRESHINQVRDKLVVAQHDEAALMANFARMIVAVRAGRSPSYDVWQLVEAFWASESSPAKLLMVMDEYAEKLEFLSMIVGSGAQYLSLASNGGQAVRNNISTKGTSYVFYFNNHVMTDTEKWEEHTVILRELLNERPRAAAIIVADYGSDARALSKPVISMYVNGDLKIKDLLKEKKALASKHLIRFKEHEVEIVTHIPSQRRALVLPCPNSDCEDFGHCEWTCFNCHVIMEYSPTNGYLYCECGKIYPDIARYNCQRPQHGAKFSRYSSGRFNKLVETLPPPPELNILILGETGVGKSTFINAFVNYLTFPTLDEGIDAAKLNWVIPSSFHTQITDPNSGKLISTKVQIGDDDNEHDTSKGASATQQATVYPLYLNGTLVRLIDTPGIGDVRGIEQDRTNLANVLSVLRNYSDLHGILILLKPNNARLNVMFRFCVKELLSSLHRNAASNIAFGFTNTRGSDYKPGDTFAPLNTLLSEYNDVIPGLYDHNVYCFDSESFRYLAAQKNGVDMGTVEDYRRSWDQSTKEADRLMAYFKGLTPHHVQETLSLNETRHLISQLTAPIQQISQAITDSIAKNAKQIQDLADMQLTGKELSEKLQIQKVVVKAKQLSKPKTVCSHEACVMPVPAPNGFGTVLLRKSLCHDPCFLTEVPPNIVGTGQLISCAAFTGGRTCRKCKHDWKEHEHIMVEYSKTSENSTDPQVQAALSKNGDLVTAKEAQIQALQKQMAELNHEHRFLQEAAAKFSLYMKKKSITHYNDATIEYMEVLIRDEKSKVRSGESRDRLERLERDKTQYESYVAAMESGKQTENGSVKTVLDEEGVAALVAHLYSLKHYGRMLKDISKVVNNAYKANFRERPYRISGRRIWSEGHQVSRRGQSAIHSWDAFHQNFRPGSSPEVISSGTGFRDIGFKKLTSRLRKPPPKFNEKQALSDSREDEKRAQPVRSIVDWNGGNASEVNDNNGVPRNDYTAGPPPYTETVSGRSPWATHNRSTSSRSDSKWSKMVSRFRPM